MERQTIIGALRGILSDTLLGWAIAVAPKQHKAALSKAVLPLYAELAAEVVARRSRPR